MTNLSFTLVRLFCIYLQSPPILLSTPIRMCFIVRFGLVNAINTYLRLKIRVVCGRRGISNTK